MLTKIIMYKEIDRQVDIFNKKYNYDMGANIYCVIYYMRRFRWPMAALILAPAEGWRALRAPQATIWGLC